MQALHTYTTVPTRHQNVLTPGSQCSTSGTSSRPVFISSTSRTASRLAAQAAAVDEAPRQQRMKWTYKYKRLPSPSPCKPGEQLCCEVEALVQNVLSFPVLPMRLYRSLANIKADINNMTSLVEGMSKHFGKELTLCYIRTQPRLLELEFNTVLQRCETTKQILNARDVDLPLLLRKCPELLTMDPQEVKQRYDNIPRVVQFTPLQVRQLVHKYPKVLSMPPQRMQLAVERLRHLSYTREEWARDFETITPSFLAFFLRDSTDIIIRLEYLASTGERPEWRLREVMKPSNRTFTGKLRNFAQYNTMVKQKRAQAKETARAAAAQAEAAAVKAALLAEDTSTSSELADDIGVSSDSDQ